MNWNAWQTTRIVRHSMTVAALGLGSALAVVVVPAAIAGPVAFEQGPNLVVNGGFETGDFSGWSTNLSGLSGVTNGVEHTGSFGVFTGETGTLGTISQGVATSAGSSYNIHFWLSSDGETPNELLVRWGGVTVFDASNLGAFDYTEFVIGATATGNIMMLEFGFRDDPGFQLFDDVSVRALPEPFSLGLLGIGLFGLGWARRKTA